jgi:hypothetical protein
VALRQTLSDGYDERPGFFVLRPEACYEVTMPFEIQWTGHQGAAMTHRDTAVEAVKFAVEMLRKGFADLDDGGKVYAPELETIAKF